MIRVGVGAPLANLFGHAARPEPADREGVDRARSAAEAFLYRRLESLPQTAGRFRLNEELPIIFDGWGKMEVDLVCARPSKTGASNGSRRLISILILSIACQAIN